MNIGTLTGAITLEDQLSGILATVASNIRKFTDGFTGAMGATAVSVGILTTAIAGAAASIVNLGEKGSVILGVEESFDRLARAVGSTGEALLGGLNEGVKGTVDSMVLMQSTNRLLSSGMKLTAADMQLMGATAREMGKATGTDAAGGLNTLSQALLTGNTRSLKRFGINIDLVKSEREFAASIGTTRDQLSAAGQLEARRIAMLEGMRTKLDVLGTSELSFKERIQQSRVAVGNWFDSLAKGVASSTAVSRAFDTIKNSIVNAFGADAQTLLQTILGWVDKFADGVTRIGPTVIQVILNVRNTIAAIWHEIVAFNERWQITNNIIAVAKLAWGLLEKAFYLVKAAVVAVVEAWSTMPDWLQKITRTALEGSIALAAYSVAINAVATPFQALIGSVDLGINILGNLTGAIYSIVSLQKLWVGSTTAATAAQGRLTLAVKGSTIATAASELAVKSITAAKAFWGTVMVSVSNTVTVMTARIWLEHIAFQALTLATNLATKAKALFNTILLAINSTSIVTAARMWLVTAGVTASGFAANASAIGMRALGTALLAIQALPIVAILGGFALAITKLVDAWKQWEKAKKEGQSFGSFLWETRDYDNWAREAAEYIGLVEDITNAEDRRRRAMERTRTGGGGILVGGRKKGGVGPTMEFLPEISPGAIPVGSAELQAARAEREREEKRLQGIGLTGESFLKADTTAEEFAKKVRDLAKSYAEAATGASVFTEAFKRLNPAQRESYDLQQLLVPEIHKLIEAHKTLTPEMRNVRDMALATKLAQLEDGAVMLENAGLTLDLVEHMKKLGMTEEDIAAQYEASRAVLGHYLSLKREDLAHDQAQIALRNSQTAQAAQQENANLKLLADSRKEYEEVVRQETMTTTDIEIFNINRWVEESLRAFDETREDYTEYSSNIQRIAAARTRAVLVDEQKLKSTSIKTLAEIAAKADATYKAMTGSVRTHTDAAIKEAARQRRATQQQLEGLDVDYDALNAASRTVLQEIADTAYNTYLYAAARSDEYSKAAIANFKRIAEAAQHTADGTISSFDKVYRALGVAGSILDQLPGKFAGVASFGVQAAQSLMQAWATGGWVGLAIEGVNQLVKGVVKLVGASRDGRNAVKDFAASFDTIAKGSGFDELHRKLMKLGDAEGGRLWILLTQGTPAGNVELAKRNIAEVQAALDALDEDIQKYNLTWRDMVNKQEGATQAAEDLVATYKRLTGAGYSADVVLKRMSTDLNQFIIHSIEAGTKIPASMRPIIEQLIRTKQLSHEAAAAMLGLRDTSMPSLADITAAADRYGIKLDELGPKVKQLQITELANQYVADWEILTAATDDWGVLFDKMGPKVQDLVTDAIKYGSELPAGMRPMLQAFVDAGKLVDDQGVKLTDLSKLTFAADLTEMFEDLILKLDELIDTITGGVGGALDELAKKKITVPVRVEVEGVSGIGKTGVVVEDTGEPRVGEHFAGGGVVYAAGGRVIPFTRRGTDTVPAMLTPGERVLTVAENKEYEQGKKIVVEINQPIMLDGRKIARNQMRYTPGELDYAGLGRTS